MLALGNSLHHTVLQRLFLTITTASLLACGGGGSGGGGGPQAMGAMQPPAPGPTAISFDNALSIQSDTFFAAESVLAIVTTVVEFYPFFLENEFPGIFDFVCQNADGDASFEYISNGLGLGVGDTITETSNNCRESDSLFFDGILSIEIGDANTASNYAGTVELTSYTFELDGLRLLVDGEIEFELNDSTNRVRFQSPPNKKLNYQVSIDNELVFSGAMEVRNLVRTATGLTLDMVVDPDTFGAGYVVTANLGGFGTDSYPTAGSLTVSAGNSSFEMRSVADSIVLDSFPAPLLFVNDQLAEQILPDDDPLGIITDAILWSDLSNGFLLILPEE